ncbi:MAG: PASTA domain-containing protein [Firmicutes bacterium]|nr:PASTA domain-containing protein [Bacillota bacterium]
MKNNEPDRVNRSRLLFIFIVFAVLFAALALRTAWHQIIKGDEYAQKAAKQQTADSVISAFRGNILDSEGNSLAVSATAHTIWVRPSTINKNGKTPEEITKNAYEEAFAIAGILDMDSYDVYEVITSDKSLCKLAKNVSSEKAEELRKLKLTGVEIIEDSKRFYPMGAFASQIIGITTDDNTGLTGIERYYDSYLSGTSGRLITSTDNNDNTLIFGKSKYYDAEDGYTLVTTINSNIQRVVEEKVAAAKERYAADRVIAIVMNPKNGEILGMAQSDEFDLNNPRSSAPGDEEYYETLTDEEKVSYWSRMWRNFCVCDVYEPGSTFKPITVALALDYGVTNMDEWFYCAGYRDVEDWTIHCWTWPWNHGWESLPYAVVNSCNSVMIELAQRMGRSNYYNGLRTFCITEKTGIDYPGEGTNIIYPEKEAGPVELATMSFGQGIAVTPISLVSAIGSLANGGKLMQPHFVKQILGSDGKVVQNIEPVVRNITVSEETAANMMDILEEVIASGGAGVGGIKGYRVGGKTGTAYKAVNGEYTEEVYTSFIGVAPMEDPSMVILVMIDNPSERYASSTAAVCEREIMQEVLLLMNIQPNYTEEELAQMSSSFTTVPDLTGQTLDDANGILAGRELQCIVSDDPGSGYHEIAVTDQYPRAGTEVKKGSSVTVYYH